MSEYIEEYFVNHIAYMYTGIDDRGGDERLSKHVALQFSVI